MMNIKGTRVIFKCSQDVKVFLVIVTFERVNVLKCYFSTF